MREITVTSAVCLDDKQKSLLESYFNDKYGIYTVKYLVNDALICGVVIFDGEKIYDGSIINKLRRMGEHLKGNIQ